jgi:hypothetical protein
MKETFSPWSLQFNGRKCNDNAREQTDNRLT